MTTRYRIRLLIKYEFDRPSGAGRQLLRICPATIPGVQRVLASAVSIRPQPQERRQFTDFFGTNVVEVVVPAGRSETTYEMVADVIRHVPVDGFDLSAPRSLLAQELGAMTSLAGMSPHHFRFASPRVPEVMPIADFAREACSAARTVREAVEALGLAIHKGMRFDAKATDVDTPIATAFEGRHGVCQDFSQIMICGLRSLGIPAAYVSGFLRTLPPEGEKKLQGADAMHAWVRAYAGGEAGWIEYDPTNACFANGDHVVIGYGRDYSDAAPITGMLRLDGAQRTSHSVDVEEV